MGAMTEYKHGQFSWVDLMAHDMAAAKEFYGGLFGWNCNDQDTQGGPPYGIFQLNGSDVAGVGQMNDEMKAQGVPPIWNSYVFVDNADDAVAKAAELGGAVLVPVMDVMDAGRMAVIQDPTGGTVSFWQAGAHCGATLVNEPNTFCWNELATRDVEAARDYYGRLFGWQFREHAESPSKYYIIECAGRDNGGLMEMTEEWGEVPPHWTVYFSVSSVDETIEKLKELGGNSMMDPFDVEVGRIGVVGDAQGAMFNLIQLKEQDG